MNSTRKILTLDVESGRNLCSEMNLFVEKIYIASCVTIIVSQNTSVEIVDAIPDGGMMIELDYNFICELGKVTKIILMDHSLPITIRPSIVFSSTGVTKASKKTHCLPP